jgi:hypothetical protein
VLLSSWRLSHLIQCRTTAPGASRGRAAYLPLGRQLGQRRPHLEAFAAVKVGLIITPFNRSHSDMLRDVAHAEGKEAAMAFMHASSWVGKPAFFLGV